MPYLDTINVNGLSLTNSEILSTQSEPSKNATLVNSLNSSLVPFWSNS